MTVEARRKNIIDKIKYVNENWLLKSIEVLLSDIKIEGANTVDNQSIIPDYSYYVGNIEDKVDLDKIKQERPLKKIDIEEFEEMANSLTWNQSIEELLEDLK